MLYCLLVHLLVLVVVGAHCKCPYGYHEYPYRTILRASVYFYYTVPSQCIFKLGLVFSIHIQGELETLILNYCIDNRHT